MSERELMMIPGPVVYDPAVLRALSAPSLNHVSPEFIRLFGNVLRQLREVCLAPSAQPFVAAGSGTLAMEMAAANLIEPGDRVLVLNTGIFGDRMTLMLERHGAEVTQLRAAVGEAPRREQLESALSGGRFKAVTITHVDTSTGVRTDVQSLLGAVRSHGALSIVDGVCAAAGERFEQDAWGADLYLTASQKALGVPPGLALMTVSPRAIDAWRHRRSPVRAVYIDWTQWLPVMEGYEGGKQAYFGTPPVNHIAAMEVSLRQILAEGMERRFARHEACAKAFRAAWRAMGLELVATSEVAAANTLSALYLPNTIDAATFPVRVREEGVVVAGGLHPEIKARSFRVGHMNAINGADVLATVGAVERALAKLGHKGEPGVGVAAAQKVLAERGG
ncbi:MAG TPA: alanine--glyoxylate aminotransferase family protein [Myxococcaceae bacterium]|jgi:alanine-glyoxylate transaminase/serine-glyoxylate transaminase/serine-pyruvate transaminase|nr:alanine--glyoxylate aminotransferase family protein [Myxococcaceae bacterium]